MMDKIKEYLYCLKRFITIVLYIFLDIIFPLIYSAERCSRNQLCKKKIYYIHMFLFTVLYYIIWLFLTRFILKINLDLPESEETGRLINNVSFITHLTYLAITNLVMYIGTYKMETIELFWLMAVCAVITAALYSVYLKILQSYIKIRQKYVPKLFVILDHTGFYFLFLVFQLILPCFLMTKLWEFLIHFMFQIIHPSVVAVYQCNKKCSIYIKDGNLLNDILNEHYDGINTYLKTRICIKYLFVFPAIVGFCFSNIFIFWIFEIAMISFTLLCLLINKMQKYCHYFHITKMKQESLIL